MKITDKKELVKLVSYMAMGDGCLWVPKGGKNAKLIITMIADNRDYVEACADILENLTSVKIYDVPKEFPRKDQVRLETRCLPFFTSIRDRIYTDKYRGIDPHALKLLDWEALAILYMCDGSCVSYMRPEVGMKNPSHHVTLNMKRLSYGDLYILKKALKDTLGLEWNINRQNKYYYLRLRSKDISRFMEGIEPYITDSFSYKILRTMNPEESGGDIV